MIDSDHSKITYIKTERGAKVGYIEQSLVPGERIVLEAQLHWAIFFGPAIGLFIGLTITALGFTGEDRVALACIGGFILLLAAIGFIGRIITYLTSEFAVTNKRLIGKTGALRRHSLEMMLNKVEGINADEPLLGRIFGYGTLVVTGTGGGKQPFPFIANVMDIRKEVVARMSSE